MLKLSRVGIYDILNQSINNTLKISKMGQRLLPKPHSLQLRTHYFQKLLKSAKRMERLRTQIGKIESALGIYNEAIISRTFTSQTSGRFSCSLSVEFPSSESFRALGVGATKKQAEESAVDIFIGTTNSICSQSNPVSKPPSIKRHLSEVIGRTNLLNAGSLGLNPSNEINLLNFLQEYRRHYSQEAIEPNVRTGRSVSSDENNTEILQFKDILKAYPAPRNRLLNFYVAIEQSMGGFTKKKLLKTHTHHSGTNWIFTFKLEWPSAAEFVGESTTKKDAAKKASLKALKWLKDLGKIDLKGNLILQDRREFMKQETRKPIARIQFSEHFVNETEFLVGEFDQEYAERLRDTCLLWDNSETPSFMDVGVPNLVRYEPPASVLASRNQELLDALEKRRQRPLRTITLPISNYSEAITDLVRKNSVVVIKGEPGCGKSTQVPQLIFDDFTKKLNGTKCNIVVTQPRKISALSIAERIAYERYEEVGNVVGFQVRFSSKLPKFRDGNIIFCTLGIMLRKLLTPDGMKGITHLIIDEAHERDLNTDILLLLAKRAVQTNPDLRVVIMSATINPELFQNYFNDAPAIHIPGFTHPVTSNFFDRNMERALMMKPPEPKKTADGHETPEVDVMLVAKMVKWVDANRPDGAILVFLPGWDVIKKVRYELEGCSSLHVVPVHSRLTNDDQRKIFMAPPFGKRKVVLATNIAETSITINDVSYVIDSGTLKEKRLHSKNGLSCLDNHWASQASIIQRKGRAGRVKPGECFHLYPKEKFDTLEKFPMPEVHRIRLEMVVLLSKTYSGNEKAERFLSQLPEPPSLAVIREAVENLQFIGALDDEENLTPLGHRISVFTSHPLISKALVYSYFFKCVNPLVTIGTILSSEIELFPGMVDDKSPIRAGKRRFSPSSDHIAMAWLYQQWSDYLTTDEYRSRQLMDEVLASHTGFMFIKRLRDLVGDHLRQCKVAPRTNLLFQEKADCNTYAVNDELIKGVFLSGVGNLLSKFEFRKGLRKSISLVTQVGHKSLITGESVNYKRTDFPSPLIAYFQEVHSIQNRMSMIRETSLVSPLTVALFLPGTLTVVKPVGQVSEDMNPDDVTLELKSKRYFNFICDERTANALVKLRDTLWTVIDYFVMEAGNPRDTELYGNVTIFHEKFLELLNRILIEAGTNIDYDENGNLRTVKEKENF